MRILGTVLALLALLQAGTLCAQNYPVRPVRIVVGFPPGGTSDILARTIAACLSVFPGVAKQSFC